MEDEGAGQEEKLTGDVLEKHEAPFFYTTWSQSSRSFPHSTTVATINKRKSLLPSA
jgi:hypothetical protein